MKKGKKKERERQKKEYKLRKEGRERKRKRRRCITEFSLVYHNSLSLTFYSHSYLFICSLCLLDFAPSPPLSLSVPFCFSPFLFNRSLLSDEFFSPILHSLCFSISPSFFLSLFFLSLLSLSLSYLSLHFFFFLSNISLFFTLYYLPVLLYSNHDEIIRYLDL